MWMLIIEMKIFVSNWHSNYYPHHQRSRSRTWNQSNMFHINAYFDRQIPGGIASSRTPHIVSPVIAIVALALAARFREPHVVVFSSRRKRCKHASTYSDDRLVGWWAGFIVGGKGMHVFIHVRVVQTHSVRARYMCFFFSCNQSAHVWNDGLEYAVMISVVLSNRHQPHIRHGTVMHTMYTNGESWFIFRASHR